MIFENIRNGLSRKICAIFRADIRDEDLLMKYIRDDFRKLLLFNGGYMSFKPDSIFLFTFYNLFLLSSEVISILLVAYTFYTVELDMGNLILVLQFAIQMIISFFIHLAFLRSRYHINEVYKITKDLSETNRTVENRLVKIMNLVRNLTVIWWPTAVSLAWASIMCLRPGYDYFYTDSSEINLPLPLSFPFDTKTSAGYKSACLIEAICVYCLCVHLNGGLPSYIFIQQRIVVEFEILMSSIQNLQKDSLVLMYARNKGDIARKDNDVFEEPQNVKESFNLYKDPKFIYCYDQCFLNVIKHHLTVLRMFFHHQMFGGMPLLIVLTLSSSMVAVSIYCIMSDVATLSMKLSTFLLVIPELFGIWIICYYGERTSSLSGEIRYQLYFTQWIHCSESVKRSLRIMQAYTLNTIGMTGAGFNVKANYETFSTIVNSTYSLINLLFAAQK